MGVYNTATGFRSLYTNTASSFHTANGAWALYSNTTGERNTAMGYQAMYTNSTGFYNTAVGYQTMYSNIDGRFNVAEGHQSLYLNGYGNFNVALGNSALYNSNGSDNTALGNRALFNVTGQSGNTAIGSGADVINGGIFNGTAVGYGTIVPQSNMMSFGSMNVEDWIFGRTTIIAGAAFQVGTAATNGNGAYLSNGGVWTNVSDENLKENFIPVEQLNILDKIFKLNISQWNYKGTNDGEKHIGPMAQQFNKLFGLGANGDDKTISTIDPSGIALAGIQELTKRNDALMSTVQLQQQQLNDMQRKIKLIEEQNKLLLQLIEKKNN
jgi:hypothetical protein